MRRPSAFIDTQLNSSRPRITIALALVLVVLVGGCSPSSSGSESSPAVSELAVSPPAGPPTEQPTPFSLNVPSPTPSPAPSATATSFVPPTPAVIRSEMVTTIDNLLANEAGVYGIVVLNSAGEYQYARNADVPFIAASLYKLVLLAEVYAQVESGTLQIDDPLPLLPEYFDDEFAAEDGFFSMADSGTETTVEWALYGCAAFSSNIAAKALISLTSYPELRARAESLGMNDTWFHVQLSEVPNWPERYDASGSKDALLAIAFIETQALNDVVNITTPNDIARFWLQLINGEVVSPAASEAILALLRQQVITDRIPWLLPEGTTANKTGNLYHVVHDSGVIFTDEGDLVLAVLSEGEPNDDHGTQVIQRVALAAIGETELPPYTDAGTATS